MELNLRGKRALVLGSSAGIGRGIAEVLAKEGARVFLNGRDAGRLEKAARSTGAEGFVVADTYTPGEAARAVREATAKMGGLDILVTNTGGPPKGNFMQIESADWRRGFEGLWMGAVEAMRESLPQMRGRKWGRILLVTSVAAREPLPSLTVSNGLRAGLTGLVKSLSHEIAADGVTVNALLPGYTRTERIAELGKNDAELAVGIPAGRLADPHELGWAAAFLASDRAAYITGQALAVDGGFTRGH